MSLNEKDELKCNFCGKIFKYKSSLKKHIETAKFCLNIQNKVEPAIENKKFINQMQDNIDNYKITNLSNKNKLVDEYQNKIEQYENHILENKDLIEKYKDISNIDVDIIEDENDKLLDGHTEIKQLDSESSKFARRITKLI